MRGWAPPRIPPENSVSRSQKSGRHNRLDQELLTSEFPQCCGTPLIVSALLSCVALQCILASRPWTADLTGSIEHDRSAYVTELGAGQNQATG
jgi:hypothetical protein